MSSAVIDKAMRLAVEHHEAGRLETASAIYRKILEMEPDNARAMHFLGVISHQVGRPDLAIKLLHRSIDLEPNKGEYHQNLGNLYFKVGRYDEAIAAFQEVIRLEPNHAAAHLHLGAALAKKGHVKEAAGWQQRGRELSGKAAPVPSQVVPPPMPRPPPAPLEPEPFAAPVYYEPEPVAEAPTEPADASPENAEVSPDYGEASPVYAGQVVEEAPAHSEEPALPITHEPEFAPHVSSEVAEPLALEPEPEPVADTADVALVPMEDEAGPPAHGQAEAEPIALVHGPLPTPEFEDAAAESLEPAPLDAEHADAEPIAPDDWESQEPPPPDPTDEGDVLQVAALDLSEEALESPPLVREITPIEEPVPFEPDVEEVSPTVAEGEPALEARESVEASTWVAEPDPSDSDDDRFPPPAADDGMHSASAPGVAASTETADTAHDELDELDDWDFESPDDPPRGDGARPAGLASPAGIGIASPVPGPHPPFVSPGNSADFSAHGPREMPNLPHGLGPSSTGGASAAHHAGAIFADIPIGSGRRELPATVAPQRLPPTREPPAPTGSAPMQPAPTGPASGGPTWPVIGASIIQLGPFQMSAEPGRHSAATPGIATTAATPAAMSPEAEVVAASPAAAIDRTSETAFSGPAERQPGTATISASIGPATPAAASAGLSDFRHGVAAAADPLGRSPWLQPAAEDLEEPIWLDWSDLVPEEAEWQVADAAVAVLEMPAPMAEPEADSESIDALLPHTEAAEGTELAPAGTASDAFLSPDEQAGKPAAGDATAGNGTPFDAPVADVIESPAEDPAAATLVQEEDLPVAPFADAGPPAAVYDEDATELLPEESAPADADQQATISPDVHLPLGHASAIDHDEVPSEFELRPLDDTPDVHAFAPAAPVAEEPPTYDVGPAGTVERVHAVAPRVPSSTSRIPQVVHDDIEAEWVELPSPDEDTGIAEVDAAAIEEHLEGPIGELPSPPEVASEEAPPEPDLAIPEVAVNEPPADAEAGVEESTEQDEPAPDEHADASLAIIRERREARRQKRLQKRQKAAGHEIHRMAQQMLRQRRMSEAIPLFQRVVELNPGSAKAHRDLGAAYLRADRLEDAVNELQRALELRPRFADAFGSLGDAYHLQGRLDDAIACYERLLERRPHASKVHSNLLLTLNYHHRYDPAALWAEHQRWADLHAAPLAAEIQPHTNTPDLARPLKVGYVSPDFRQHSVNYFIEPILAAHDRRRFVVAGYSDAIKPDGVTEQIAGRCDLWRDIRGMSDQEVAELIRTDGIDILVDLAGHTGTNRMGVFARKPAPVQVTYLGYPNTTGMETMDYRLTDATADPPGTTEAYHSERLFRLPGGFLCYQPPAESPQLASPPSQRGLSGGNITFGCFNILAKITPDVMAVWARIMAALPESRLILKGRMGSLADPGRRRYVTDIFQYHGVSPKRLDLLGKEESFARHLEMYREVDIALDPWPYNGTTTTCEALWMGVPVVTLAGNRHASRVGTSILTALSMRDLVAQTPDQYIRIATGLANNPSRLKFLRSTLRDRMRRSPLMDGRLFTSNLEAAYRQMWENWCRRQQSAARPGGGDPEFVVERDG